jgi:gliding motility-associated lipoprotein GldH
MGKGSILIIRKKGKTEDFMIKGIFKNPFLIFFSCILLVNGCDSNIVCTDSATIPGETWKLDNVIQFSAMMSDTTNSFNIYFTLRTGTSYPYRNIWLFTKTTAPSGRILTDTLEYMLADEKGKWYGKGFGDIHELNLPFRTEVYFPEKGLYTFNVRHGMRIEDLKGVYDLGFRIEKANK